MMLTAPGVESELKARQRVLCYADLLLLVHPLAVQVIDFGLATRIKPGEVLKRLVGTPYYIAPEARRCCRLARLCQYTFLHHAMLQVLDHRYSKPCDLWSVGVITFTLLCGFPPFWGDREDEIYGRIRRGHYAFEGPEWALRSHSRQGTTCGLEHVVSSSCAAGSAARTWCASCWCLTRPRG
jgi:serine/threonine protein kinase